MANRAPTLDTHVFSINDLMQHGSKKLPQAYRDFYNEGAMDLITHVIVLPVLEKYKTANCVTHSLNDNVAAYDRYKIIPRVLKNVSNVDTSTEIFGCKVTFPLGFGPSAMHKLAHSDGEEATSSAAAVCGVAMCLSSYATTALEDVKKHPRSNPYAIQMCVVKDRNITKQLPDRAEKAGYRAIFLSVDVPALGRRLNEMRNDFTLPEDLAFPNILSSGHQEFTSGAGGMAFDDTLEWDEIVPWLRQNTKMQVWLKGVLSPHDVELAIKYGVDGVIISNHGGRQLDGAPAALDALRQCAPVAQGRIRIAVDGGIRRGSDIFKAIALGAEHCFVGRIPIWGLAYNGQAGVELGLQILLHEFRVTMALAGCRSVKDISIDHLAVLGQNGLLAKL